MTVCEAHSQRCGHGVSQYSRTRDTGGLGKKQHTHSRCRCRPLTLGAHSLASPTP
jgi:hypothetical protein